MTYWVIHSFIYIQVDPKRLENLLDIEQVKWIKQIQLQLDYNEYITAVYIR
jgi:hypothetical protein